MAAEQTDIATIGHFSIDSLRLPSRSRPYRILGGAVAYVSLIARKLGCTASVISKVGADFPQTYLKRLEKEGVEVSGIVKVPTELTTSFELVYNEDLSSRKLRLRTQGSPITPSQIKNTLSAKVIHVAPIASEIPFELVEHLKGCCECLSLDPQGMTRRFNQNGYVACCAQMDKRILPLVNVYKSALEEIEALTGQCNVEKAAKAIHDLGPEIVIVTMGAKGSVLSAQGEILKIPACKPSHVVDPTGAGDVFIGAFLAEYIRKKNLRVCACVGSAAASMVVEGVGITFFGEKEEIYRRASAVYEKEIKH